MIVGLLPAIAHILIFAAAPNGKKAAAIVLSKRVILFASAWMVQKGITP